MSTQTDIAHAIKGIHFPAERKELVETAKSNHASPTVIKGLEKLHERTYNNVTEVMHDLGHHTRK